MDLFIKTFIDSIDEGIIAIDSFGIIAHFNQSASRISNIKPQNAIGKSFGQLFGNTALPQVLKAEFVEKELAIDNNIRIVAKSIPVIDDTQSIIGTIVIFRDITRLTDLTVQNTALMQMQSLLEAIINASDDAISVVDENGCGIIINPAYTRLTGLSEEDVIGKSAEFDIAEGESAHMQVLKNRKPLRGARLKVKPQNKDVLANVAPIIVEGTLKGSVAIVHDLSEMQRLADELSTAKHIIRSLAAKYTFSDIIGQSAQLKTSIHWAKKAAGVPVTVLIRGESGTGKELFAHAIHNESARKNNQFVRVNCAAVVENLFESQLFGYVEGAFTGAKRGGQKGLFEEADQGTLFFDEISELSTNTQAKLLRALQEKEIVRVGGSKPISVDVRVIAATHTNLEEAVQEGRFRQDLYYRLNVMPIFIPPLRLRREDIPDLAFHIIKRLNQDFGRNVHTIESHAMEILCAYPWYGNVRELENILSQSITKMKYNEIQILPEHLPDLRSELIHPEIRAGCTSTRGPNGVPEVDLTQTGKTSLKSFLARAEKEFLISSLAANLGNKVKTARKLNISIRSLYDKIKRYNLVDNQTTH